MPVAAVSARRTHRPTGGTWWLTRWQPAYPLPRDCPGQPSIRRAFLAPPLWCLWSASRPTSAGRSSVTAHDFTVPHTHDPSSRQGDEVERSHAQPAASRLPFETDHGGDGPPGCTGRLHPSAEDRICRRLRARSRLQRRLHGLLLLDPSRHQSMPAGPLRRRMVASGELELLPDKRSADQSLLHRLPSPLHVHKRLRQLLQQLVHRLQL